MEEKNKERMIKFLTSGRNSAKELENLLRREFNVDSPVSVKDLLMEILGSFYGCLSILNSSDSGEICGLPASPYAGLASSVDRIPEVYSGRKPAPGVKERRGCYKRRRTIDSIIKISGTTEDGHAWRKYGQKEILNSKFPRCYYRCTHKHVHGCKAQKQVQKLKDEPNKAFHITYIGHHTCPTKNTHSHDHQNQVVLDFEDSKITHHRTFSNTTPSNIHISPSTTVKQEVHDSKTQSTTDDVSSDNVSSANDAAISSSSTVLRWNDVLMEDEMIACHVVGAPIMGFDHEDSSASADTSSHSYFNLNMDYFNNGDLLSDINLLDGVFS